MANKIIASSLNNFIILNNTHTTDSPYVTFTVGSPSNTKVIIKDANNDDGYYKEIIGNSTSVISSDSFNTSGVVALNFRSEEHTSELQSPDHLVCRLLL